MSEELYKIASELLLLKENKEYLEDFNNLNIFIKELKYLYNKKLVFEAFNIDKSLREKYKLIELLENISTVYIIPYRNVNEIILEKLNNDQIGILTTILLKYKLVNTLEDVL